MPGYLDPSDVTTVTVFWGAPVFATATVYHEDDICRPTTDNGYYYKCITDGTSGATEPATWSQTEQTSGTAVFKAMPYDLWILPSEQLQTSGENLASVWTATNEVTLTNPLNDTVATSVVISAIPEGVTEFEVTNTARKDNGEKLSKTMLYRVNEQ